MRQHPFDQRYYPVNSNGYEIIFIAIASDFIVADFVHQGPVADPK